MEENKERGGRGGRRSGLRCIALDVSGRRIVVTGQVEDGFTVRVQHLDLIATLASKENANQHHSHIKDDDVKIDYPVRVTQVPRNVERRTGHYGRPRCPCNDIEFNIWLG